MYIVFVICACSWFKTTGVGLEKSSVTASIVWRSGMLMGRHFFHVWQESPANLEDPVRATSQRWRGSTSTCVSGSASYRKGWVRLVLAKLRRSPFFTVSIVQCASRWLKHGQIWSFRRVPSVWSLVRWWSGWVWDGGCDPRRERRLVWRMPWSMTSSLVVTRCVKIIIIIYNNIFISLIFRIWAEADEADVGAQGAKDNMGYS